jgi:hypothetical protein
MAAGHVREYADLWWRPIQLQHARATETRYPEPRTFEEIVGVMDESDRAWVDLGLYVVALTRLRAVAELAWVHMSNGRRLGPAIAAFDQALPGLTDLRNAIEHPEHFVPNVIAGKVTSDKGHGWGSGKGEIELGGHKITLDVATEAAAALYAAIDDLVTELIGPNEVITLQVDQDGREIR